MNSNYVYKKAEKEDIENIDRFNCIGKDDWHNDFFSDEKPMSFLYICLYDGKVIGTQGYMNYDMHYSGRKVVTHRAERTLVAANHRGKGVFDNLEKRCDENGREYNSHMCWGATTSLKAYANAGFEKYTGFRTYLYYPVRHTPFSKIKQVFKNYRLFDPYKLYKSYKSRDIVYLKQILSFYSFLKGTKKIRTDIEFTFFDLHEVYRRIAANTFNAEVYALYFDDSLIRWLDKKGKMYQYHQVAKNGNNVGHVIYYINKESKLINVVDMFLDGDTYVAEVFSALSEKCSNSGSLSIFIALNNENEYQNNWIKSLKSKGIFAKDNLGNFVIKNLLPGNSSRIPISKLLLSDLWLEL